MNKKSFVSRNRKEVTCFAVIILPVLFVTLFLLKFQVSDIGGAKRDARVGHFPLIEHLALNQSLPDPDKYSVANIPLWHYLMSWIYGISKSEISIHVFQILISITGLFVFYSVILKFTSRGIAVLASVTITVNSYFIAASFYPTTDGLALNLFILFCAVLNRRLRHPERIKDVFLLNAIMALSALNRQMFLFLFVIYGLVFIRRKPITRIVLELMPAMLVVLVGFYLFYERYCQFRISDSCWPVRQSEDLYFPVLVNFSIVSFLVAFFCLPVLNLNKEYAVVSRRRTLQLFLIVLMFYTVLGEQIIQRGNFVVGGGLYKAREKLGDVTILFDSVSVSLFILVLIIAHKKLRETSWVLLALLVLAVSSFFGPFAFQRYFEPYILILVLIYFSSNWRKIFGDSRARFYVWAVVLMIFQSVETGLSLFINI